MQHRIGNQGRKYSGKRGAGIIFTDGNKILLLKRAEGDHTGSWGQPGGKAKEGETNIDTAIRESKEECGNFEGYRIAEFEEKDGLHRWTTYIYRIKQPFDCKLSKEHSDWKWYDIDKLKYVDLHPKFRENVGAYIKLIKKKFGNFKTFHEWLQEKCPCSSTETP